MDKTHGIHRAEYLVCPVAERRVSTVVHAEEPNRLDIQEPPEKAI